MNHKYVIDNKELFVEDCTFLMNERESIFLNLKSVPYTVSHQIITDQDSDLFIAPLNKDFFNDVPYFLHNIFKKLNEIYPGQAYNIERIIGICWTMSNKIAIHGDSDSDERLTVLYHANYEWNSEWGGANLFYNDQITDIAKAVQYVPGRLVVFDSRIPHSVSTINEKKLRFTISLLLKKINYDNKNNYSC